MPSKTISENERRAIFTQVASEIGIRPDMIEKIIEAGLKLIGGLVSGIIKGDGEIVKAIKSISPAKTLNSPMQTAKKKKKKKGRVSKKPKPSHCVQLSFLSAVLLPDFITF